MEIKSFHLTARGASHIRKNKICQDFSGSTEGESYALAVVCDGHGGDDYIRSDVGARLACEAAERNIREFLDSVQEGKLFAERESLLKPLEASIINEWNESVYSHYAEHPFTQEELEALSDRAKIKYLDKGRMESAYGTTLIAVVLTKRYWFGLQIGDGKCVAIDHEGEFSQPVPWDEHCFLNATTSICDSRALENFREYFSDELPAAVFIGSDGIDDCFGTEEQLYHLYETMTYSFGTEAFEDAVKELEEYLPRLSAMGSGDDVSVAAVLDMEAVPNLKIVTEFQEKEERLRAERKAKAEAEAKAKAEAEAKAREEKARAEAKAKAMAEAEVRRKMEASLRVIGEAQEKARAKIVNLTLKARKMQEDFIWLEDEMVDEMEEELEDEFMFIQDMESDGDTVTLIKADDDMTKITEE